MSHRTALLTAGRVWKCPQCTLRSLSTSARKQEFGPEHPRYIEVPEPPQQTLPYRPLVKGRLPVPRNVFAGRDGIGQGATRFLFPIPPTTGGAGLESADNEKSLRKQAVPEPGSSEEWKQKLSESRQRLLGNAGEQLFDAPASREEWKEGIRQAHRRNLEEADDEMLALSTKLPQKRTAAGPGSRKEWKQKLSETRRRNLQEGLRSLRSRRITQQRIQSNRRAAEARERYELQSRPERLDEQLTAPSNGLDLEKLLHGPLEDPTREARLKHKARNLLLHTRAKKASRLDDLHTLYMNARDFIVTPEQLDAAIEEEFDKKQFTGARSAAQGQGVSMWDYGPPSTVQEMLSLANRSSDGKRALQTSGGVSQINQERVKRIAEKLTGGKMDG